MAKRQDGRKTGDIFWRGRRRLQVRKRGDGRKVAVSRSGRQGGRKLGRTLHRMVHYPDQIPAVVSQNIYSWRRAGFHQVVWCFHRFPSMKGVRVRKATAAIPRKRFNALTQRGVSIPHVKDEVCMYALREVGGWWADLDVWPLKEAKVWEKDVKGQAVKLSTVPLRAPNLPLSPKTADWERGQWRHAVATNHPTRIPSNIPRASKTSYLI